MSLKAEVENHLSTYLKGEISLVDFEDWFIPTAWEIEKKRVDFSTKKIVNVILLRLAEFSIGDWTEQELREHLVILLPASSGSIPIGN